MNRRVRLTVRLGRVVIVGTGKRPNVKRKTSLFDLRSRLFKEVRSRIVRAILRDDYD
jgi:hypothetical protein